MANEDPNKTPAAAKPTAKAGAAKASGLIVYNKYLDCWRCVNAAGKTVLSGVSKQAAINAYPDFTVKE